MLDSRKVAVVEAAASEVPKVVGTTFFGWVTVSAGKVITDNRGRAIIKLTKDALSSLEAAVKTVGHELHHIGEILAGSGASESAAEKAGELFWKTFLKRL